MFKECAYRLFHKISIFEPYTVQFEFDIKKEAKIWGIQKSIEAEEKLALKREEQEKEIRKNNQKTTYA